MDGGVPIVVVDKSHNSLLSSLIVNGWPRSNAIVANVGCEAKIRIGLSIECLDVDLIIVCCLSSGCVCESCLWI